MSKVIVFDLDETLRKIENPIKNGSVPKVILRPKLINLLKKIKEVKNQGVDSVIFTSASLTSVDKFFFDKLPEEYREVFTQTIARENFPETKPGTRENYLYKAKRNKAVTALDYDEILFFDDNRTEYEFLKELFDEKLYTKYPVPNKNVTFVSLPFNPRPEVDMYVLKELAKDKNIANNKITGKINNYFDIMLQEPGCKIMSKIIDEFISKNHKKGLIDNSEIEEFEIYEKNVKKLYYEIDEMIDDDIFWRIIIN